MIDARATLLTWTMAVAIASAGCAGGAPAPRPAAAGPAIRVELMQRGGGPPAALVTAGDRTLLRTPEGGAWHTGGDCRVTPVLRPADGGLDVELTVANPSSAPAALPTLLVEGLRLGGGAEYLDHRFGCDFRPFNAFARGAVSSRRDAYPRSLYAPALVARDRSIAVAIAVHHPVLEHRHEIEMQLARPAGASAWRAVMRLDGEMPPGATRRYHLSMRWVEPERWVDALEPYRDFFWNTYGRGPAYERDLRPVRGAILAGAAFCDDDNTRGYKPPHRPDRDGWASTVDDLLGAAQAGGFERVMVWLPSGCYRRHVANNFPPQIMSAWTPAQVQTASQWRRFADAGVELSFWWGRSAQVADRWDDDVLEPFDPTDPAHRSTMLREWELAVERGAAGVGLDAFNRLPTWEAAAWLDALRAVAPEARIVIEPQCADLLHARAPMLVQGRRVSGPHLLADYLVPGGEIWVLLRGEEASLVNARRCARWGMTVCTKTSRVSADALEREVPRGEGAGPAPR